MSPAGEKNGFHLLRCAACRTVTTNPYPSDAELAAFYSSQYHMTDSYLGKSASKLRRGLGRVKRMKRQKPPGKKFLDIGCSLGSVVKAAEMLGLDAHGIDIDPTAITAARAQHGQTCHFEFMSIQELAKRDGAVFDMVYLSEVIEHVRDPEDFVAHISAVMRPGAIAYITCPDGGHFRTPRVITDWKKIVCPPEHLTYFTRQGMTRLLSRHGLEVFGFQWAFKPGMKVFARKA
jgi:2-polyprenyl-3-methyl-5-hydroxy-6-metoxy-1,4-benzoquinol methylase